MIGGKIIEVRRENKAIRLWVVDHRQLSDEAIIHIAAHCEIPQPGDDIWWQADAAYWTPKDKRFTDFRFQRIGYSRSPNKDESADV